MLCNGIRFFDHLYEHGHNWRASPDLLPGDTGINLTQDTEIQKNLIQCLVVEEVTLNHLVEHGHICRAVNRRQQGQKKDKDYEHPIVTYY